MFHGFLLFSLAIGIVTLGALLVTVLLEGWQYVDAVLLFEPPSADPSNRRGGARRSSRRSTSASC